MWNSLLLAKGFYPHNNPLLDPVLDQQSKAAPVVCRPQTDLYITLTTLSSSSAM